jgi:hypothetical protein
MWVPPLHRCGALPQKILAPVDEQLQFTRGFIVASGRQAWLAQCGARYRERIDWFSAGPAGPTHNPINTDGESLARLPALLFGFSLNHRSTNAIGPRVRSARSEPVVIGMRYFSLCARRQSSTKCTGALDTSANSRQPTTGRTAHWAQAIVRTDRCRRGRRRGRGRPGEGGRWCRAVGT